VPQQNYIIKKLRQFKRKHFRSLSIELEERILAGWFQTRKWSGNIIDIGGGSAPYSKYLDAAANVINLNIEKCNETNLIADAHSIPIKKGSIDAVIITNVLEHVRQPEKVLNEIAEVMKAGGEMMLVVPFMFKVHPNPEDHWRFTYQSLELMLKDNFEIIDLRASGGRFSVIWEILMQIRGFEIFKFLNRFIAKLDMESKDYALAYSILARRKS